MNIFTATRNLTFVGKLFAAAKLNLEQFIESGDESALAAHVEAQRTSAAPAAVTTVTVDTTAIETALLTAAGITIATGQTPTQALAAHVAAATDARTRNTSLVSALNAAGVKFSADAKPEQVAKALEDRISTRAGEELAKRGVGSAFISDNPSNNPASAASDAKKAAAGSKPGVAGLVDIFRSEAAAK